MPDPDTKVLRVRVHTASRPAANRALIFLLNQINEAEVQYPGTDMNLVYDLGGINSS